MSEARAEVSSSVPTKADNPLDSLDAEAQFAVRLAAEIGRQSNYVVTVSFTSLLVALLYTRSNVLEYIAKEAPSIEFEYVLNHFEGLDVRGRTVRASGPRIGWSLPTLASAQRILNA